MAIVPPPQTPAQPTAFPGTGFAGLTYGPQLTPVPTRSTPNRRCVPFCHAVTFEPTPYASGLPSGPG